MIVIISDAMIPVEHFTQWSFNFLRRGLYRMFVGDRFIRFLVTQIGKKISRG